LIPTNCFLIGGGARDNYGGGVGNMLVYSRPGGRTSWLVEGKDHRRPCPCTITAYAIGIEDISYPTVGNIEVDYITQQDEGVKHGEGFVYSRVLPGWALTCCGGKTDYNGAGRMLIGIYPIPDTDAQTVSKDHTWYDFGFTYSFASMIRKAI